MRILPVIDLLNGEVVRGIAGERQNYRAIQSPLVADARPVTVGGAYHRLGLNECYVADLDAIAGRSPCWSALRDLIELGLDVWLDAGCGSPVRARELVELRVDGRQLASIVVGSESLPSIAALKVMIALIGPKRLVFSLDLKAGRPITMPGVWREKDALQIANEVATLGVERLIVLDLAAVGANHGPPTQELCRAIQRAHPGLELCSGGGVRGVEDLRALDDAGCSYALVASALHDGRLTPADLPAYR